MCNKELVKRANVFPTNGGAVGETSDWQIGEPCRTLDLLERRLVHSHTTAIIPLHDRVIFVRSLNCAEFSSRFSEIAQPLDAISEIQFLFAGRGLGEPWLLGSI